MAVTLRTVVLLGVISKDPRLVGIYLQNSAVAREGTEPGAALCFPSHKMSTKPLCVIDLWCKSRPAESEGVQNSENENAVCHCTAFISCPTLLSQEMILEADFSQVLLSIPKSL